MLNIQQFLAHKKAFAIFFSISGTFSQEVSNIQLTFIAAKLIEFSTFLLNAVQMDWFTFYCSEMFDWMVLLLLLLLLTLLALMICGCWCRLLLFIYLHSRNQIWWTRTSLLASELSMCVSSLSTDYYCATSPTIISFSFYFRLTTMNESIARYYALKSGYWETIYFCFFFYLDQYLTHCMRTFAPPFSEL